jgi:hypothetical protein
MSKWKGLAFFLFFLSFIWFVGGISVVYYIIAAGDGTIAVIMVTVLMGISLAAAYGGYRSLRKSKIAPAVTRPACVRQPTASPQVSPPQEARAERMVKEVGSGLIRIYVILFRRSLSPEEYAERTRSSLGVWRSDAVVVGTPPSDENFAKNAIREVCGDIWSTPPVPEVKIEKDDPQYFRSIPGVAGGGMNDYAISFLKRKITQGEDPDYFNIYGYTVYVTTTTDRITGDGALVIRINR